MKTRLMILTTLIAGTAMTLPAYGQATPAPAQQGQMQQSTNLNQIRQLVEQAEQSLAREDRTTAQQALEQARQQITTGLQRAQGQAQQSLTRIRQRVDAAWQAYQQQDYAGARQQLAEIPRADWGGGQTQTAQAGQQGTEGADTVTVQPQAPTIEVETPDPRVTVRQTQPDVMVRQGQPEIIVRQSAPTVTVNIPEPQITVRMPQPDVRVSQQPPEVQVEQGQPRVSVAEQPEPQVRLSETEEDAANVQLTRPAEEANVQIQRAEQRPVIRYEREEAQVRVTQGEGEPEVRYEQMAAGEQQQGQQQQAQQQQAQQQDMETTAAIQPDAPRESANEAVNVRSVRDLQLTVGQLKGYDIVGADNETLGDVEDVVNVGNRLYAVISSGGFLGLGEDQVAIPLSSLLVSGENFVAPNVTEERIEELEDFNADAYPSLPDNHPVTVGSS